MSTEPQRTASSGLAVASLVLGIIGLCVLPLGVVAVVLGHLALGRIRRSAVPMDGKGLAVAGLVTGYLGTFFTLVFVVALALGVFAGVKSEKESRELFPIEEVVPPDFSDLGEGRAVGSEGVTLHEIETAGEGVGQSMRFRIYVPGGSPEPKSLPCVLVAPAGSNMLGGIDLDGGDYHDETLPYAEAGMVVITYSVDGIVEDEDADESVGEGYEAFRAAAAGVVNGRNARDLARELPFVDPERIFSAGHSSAATISLLLAAHLPDLAGSVAYAPVIDLDGEYGELAKEPFVELVLPGLAPFLVRSSPATHVESVEVPVLLFYARDDERVSLDDGRAFVRSLEDRGIDATLKTVPEGGHYASMIERGIPSGIEWIQARE